MKFKTLCEVGAKLVKWPEGINGFALLWAIGGVESSFGVRAVPKYEEAFDWGGRYAEPELLKEHGSLAACSLGPWQVMFSNVHSVTKGEVKPLHMYEPPTALIVTCMFMQERVIDKGAKTVEEIADAWNSGTHKDGIVPYEYIRKVKAIYNDVSQSSADPS
jgi:hypothetical protein